MKNSKKPITDLQKLEQSVRWELLFDATDEELITIITMRNDLSVKGKTHLQLVELASERLTNWNKNVDFYIFFGNSITLKIK